MDVQKTLTEREAALLRNYAQMNVKGQEMFFEFSFSMAKRFAIPTAQVIQFTPRKQKKIA
jgi:hypothetical protein